MNKRYLVTYYFTSGLTTQVSYSEENWKKVQAGIAKGWNTASVTDEFYGINFAQVTHYEAEEE